MTTMTAPDSSDQANRPVTVPPQAGPRRWKVGLALTAIFLCGAVVGVLGTLRALQGGPRRNMDPAQWSAMVLNQLDGRLHLTAAQRERLAPLMRAGAEEARTARRRAFGEARAIIERTHAQISAELDDQQRVELDKFIAERHRRARRWFGPEGGRGGPPGPHP